MNITRSITSERDRALLSGDHSTYHAQETRRIHTLRKRLGATTPKGRKYTSKAPVTSENVVSNVEWVQLLLACAERAWASAMAMKSAQSPENTQKPMPGSTKTQIASRLTKAVSYAENLVAVLGDGGSKASKLDTLEAKAYLFMLKGTLDFEKERWQSCLSNYSLPRLIYTTLGKSGKGDAYKDLLSSVVEPSLRYASFKLKMPRTKPVEDIAVENFPSDQAAVKSSLTEIDSHAFDTAKNASESRADGQDIPTHITWRTRKVKLEDSTISEALGRASLGEKALIEKLRAYREGKSGAADLAAAYDDVIEARQDAVDATKSAIDELIAEGVDTGDQRIQSLQITRTAVNYAVIEYRIGRNRVLCGPDDGLRFEPEQRKQPLKKSNGKQRHTKPESTGRQLSRLREHVALFDSILQSVDAVKELPGVIADEAFVRELDAKHAYFRALKCLSIGRSHAINSHVGQALALFARALELAQTASSALSSASKEAEADSDMSVLKLQLSTTSLKTATDHLSALVTRQRALAELKNLSSAPTSTTKATFARPLVETLHHNVYHDNVDLMNLVNYPPKLQPIPVKPLFFDIAWNYITYPGHEKDAPSSASVAKAANGAKDTDGDVDMSTAADEKTPQQQQQEKKRGWFGFGR
jgi:signal recognition particle subunit SRP68